MARGGVVHITKSIRSAKMVLAEILKRPRTAPGYKAGHHSSMASVYQSTTAAVNQLADDMFDVKHLLQELIRTNEIQHAVLQSVLKCLPEPNASDSSLDSLSLQRALLIGTPERQAVSKLLCDLLTSQSPTGVNDFTRVLVEHINSADSPIGRSIRDLFDEL
jgi:hypothetical protein